MIVWLIEKCLHNRLLVVIVTAVLLAAGVWAMSTTPVDAIPDLSDVQVIVLSHYDGQSPQSVEDQVTYPLTTAMLSVPHARTVRGFSFFGLSMVYVIFEDGTDLYWARSRVLESLNVVQGRLPEGVTSQLGPDATGVGWVFQYTLTSTRHDLAQLRSIQDWYLRYDLMSLQGVAEVASVGGYTKQYRVEVDPERLRAFGLTLEQVNSSIKKANVDVGGRLLEMGETEFMVRGRGYLQSLEDLRTVPIGLDQATNTPVLLSQVADVAIGPEIRRGLVEMDGKGEAVSGIVIMRHGENALKVIERVKERLGELKEGLPEGVEVHTSYDRSSLIMRAIDTLRSKLVEEMIVVALVIVIFLLHLRSALVAAITLPAGILISLLVMRLLGMSANIMSLGGIAIAIGVMVDASVVMVENLHKHRERNPSGPQLEVVLAASREVGPALFFSLLIITVSFLPVFTLEQQEGRLFAPLAFTKTFAMAASAILAVTLIPVLMYYFVRGKTVNERSHPLSRFFTWVYRPVLKGALRFPVAIVLLAVVMVAAAVWPLSKLGSEFMPPLNEGDLLYMPTTTPGISITKARELLQQTDKIIASHPQVKHVLGKAGRAETATDPAPLSMLETVIILEEKETWPAGKTIEDIIDELDRMVRFPGLTSSWTMPIKTRTDMLATGMKTPVGIKILGEDLEQLSETGEEIEGILKGLPGTASVYSERVYGGNYVDITVLREEAARFGLSVADVQQVIGTAIGGKDVTWTVEGLERYPVNVRYPRELRNNIQKLEELTVQTPLGHAVALGQVARVEIAKGPAAIKSENARRTAWVYVDIDTSDIGGYVERAKQLVSNNVDIPDGVSIIWSGQYEYMERVARKLMLVIPLTLVTIFLLLFVHFKNVIKSAMVMVTLPFALVGGIWLLYWFDYNLSVAVAVGFIALTGLAAETGVVMLVYLDEAFGRWKREGRLISASDLATAVVEGAVERLRPKLMTVLTTTIGLLPIMLGTETGTRIMKRIAAPMIGGMGSSMMLTLVILPVIYYLWKRRGLSSDPRDTKASGV